MGTGQRYWYRPPTWAIILLTVLLGGIALVMHTLHDQQHLAAAAATEQYRKRQLAKESAPVEQAAPVVAAVASSSSSTSPPPPPPPSPPPSPKPVESAGLDQCTPKEALEYDGNVVMWGTSNMQPSVAACCESCHAHRKRATERSEPGCTVWVYCAKEGGCSGTQKKGECWGKAGAKPIPAVRGRGPGCDWTSGEALTAQEAAEMAAALEAVAATERERRERPTNPRVFFDVEVNGKAHGRIEFVLYAKESPRHAENFRAMCTGEKGGKLHFKGMKFYRIIDMFIDQARDDTPAPAPLALPLDLRATALTTGPNTPLLLSPCTTQAGVHGASSIWGGSFDDDPGGLLLKHDKGGLLSAANGGPDTNSGHFSVVVAPAPHLNGGYTVFGEVVAGWDTMWAINKLTTKGTDRVTGTAVVTESGCLKSCEPRPEVGPKCKTRASTPGQVQGRTIKPCLD